MVKLTIVPKKLSVCICVCLLAACAAPPQPSKPSQQTQAPSVFEPEAPTQTARTVEDFLAELAQLSEPTQQLNLLLSEIELRQDAHAWQTSAVLLSEVERFNQTLSASQHRRYTFAQARWLAHQQQFRDAMQRLTPLLQQPSLDTLQLARDLSWQLGERQQAAQFELDRLAQQADTDSQTSWAYLKHAPEPTALRAQGELARPWLGLLQAAHQQVTRADPSALQGWQLRYPNHPGQAVVSQMREKIEQYAPHHALVLLPLSGQYAEQGQAVLDGMVLALEATPEFTITIRDSAQFDFSQLAEVLQAEQADMLIGPLLKDNLEQVTTTAVQNVQWMALNAIDELGAIPDLWYALAPETEITQIARRFADKGYQQPLVLAADSNRGKQAVETFAEAFYQLQPEGKVEQGFYRTPDDMKAIVQEKLGVTDSEARIWQVKIAAGKIIVDAEARSRADIDAIFLPGSIEQTRLLKPFIDVTISPFMQALPVYATSASHIRGDALSENDLDNVRFTELPWLLPNHPQHQRLQALLRQRQHWSTGLARLAAFGHDAVNLVRHYEVLTALPGYQLAGLTGTLTGAPDNMQRQLDWAQYDGHNVVPEVDGLE